MEEWKTDSKVFAKMLVLCLTDYYSWECEGLIKRVAEQIDEHVKNRAIIQQQVQPDNGVKVEAGEMPF